MTAGNPIPIAKFVAEDFISKSKLERCVVQISGTIGNRKVEKSGLRKIWQLKHFFEMSRWKN